MRGARQYAAWIAVSLAIGAHALTTAPLVAQSRTQTLRVPSAILGETRIVHVSLPPNYKLSRQRYPLILLLDGQAKPFFDLTVAVTGYDLIGDEHEFAMPQQIVVGVEQSDRSADLSRNDIMFTRFITNELLPLIEREYRTLPFRTLIGHSLGGRFALLSLCRIPDWFSATIAISPSVSDSIGTNVRDCVSASAPKTSPSMKQVVLSAGSRETRSLAGVESLSRFLRDSTPAHWRTTRIDGEGLGHTETPFYTIPDGLRFVFATEVWEIDRAAADSLLTHRGEPQRVLDAALATVSARVGYRVSPSSKWMAAVVRAYLAQSNTAAATESARKMIAAYPEELLSYALLADASLAARDKAGAKRALTDALAMLDKLEWFDETQRERQRAHFRQALGSIVP